MEKQDIINEFKKIADEFGLKLEVDEHSDGSYVDVSLVGGVVDLDVIIPRHFGKYYAYDISSTSLPREFYFSPKENNFTPDDEDERSREIIDNVRNLLGKKLQFHHAPGILNKKRGYITLPVDGKPTRLYQKYNAFGLPLA